VQFVKHLLWVARALLLLVQSLLTFFAVSILHLNEQVVVLNLRFGDNLLGRARLFHQHHILLQARLFFLGFLLQLALVLLILNVALLILLPEIHLVRKLLVRVRQRPQVRLNLLNELPRFRLVSGDLVFQLTEQANAPLQSLLVVIGEGVHFCLQLPEVLVIPVCLVVVFVDTHDMILLALLHV